MSRRYQPKRKPAGLSPGTLIYSGRERTDQVRLTVIDYDGDHLTEMPIDESAGSAWRCATPRP